MKVVRVVTESRGIDRAVSFVFDPVHGAAHRRDLCAAAGAHTDPTLSSAGRAAGGSQRLQCLVEQLRGGTGRAVLRRIARAGDVHRVFAYRTLFVSNVAGNAGGRVYVPAMATHVPR